MKQKQDISVTSLGTASETNALDLILSIIYTHFSYCLEGLKLTHVVLNASVFVCYRKYRCNNKIS